MPDRHSPGKQRVGQCVARWPAHFSMRDGRDRLKTPKIFWLEARLSSRRATTMMPLDPWRESSHLPCRCLSSSTTPGTGELTQLSMRVWPRYCAKEHSAAAASLGD